jgi:predicted transcriptional regulator
MAVSFALEFFVLTYYSSFMWSQPDEGSGAAPVAPNEGTGRELLIQIRELQKIESQKAEQTAATLRVCQEAILGLQNNTNQFQRTSSSLLSQLQENQTALQQSAGNLVSMEKTLKEFIEGKMHEQVEAEVREIMSSIVLQRLTGKGGNETKS